MSNSGNIMQMFCNNTLYGIGDNGRAVCYMFILACMVAS